MKEDCEGIVSITMQDPLKAPFARPYDKDYSTLESISGLLLRNLTKVTITRKPYDLPYTHRIVTQIPKS